MPYDEINALIMTEPATRLAALRSGKLDVLGTAGDSQLRSIDQIKSLRETNPEINMWDFIPPDGVARLVHDKPGLE